jgi:translation initiation factor IF-2
MQTVAGLAKRLGVEAEQALEKLRYMMFEVEGIDSEVSDEECDLLIEVDEDPEVAEKTRAAKLKLKQKAEDKARKDEAKRKAAEKKKKAEEKAAAEDAALKKKPAARRKKGVKGAEEAAEAAVAEGPEGLAAEAGAIAAAQAAEVAEMPIGKVAHGGKVLAEILPEEKKGPTIVIGSAIDHDARSVSILRADGTRLDTPDADIIEAERPPAIEEEEEAEEFGLLAEAQRRQEEEDRRRAKVAARPLPQPDPAVVAEVIRRAQERSQRLKGADQQKAAKQLRLQKQQKMERAKPVLAGDEEVVERRTGSTGKTARKRQRRAEKARTEETLRREAAVTLREFQASGTLGALKKRKRKRTTEEEGAEVEVEEREVIEVEDRMTVEQLAEAVEVSVNEIILDLMDLNILANKNQTLNVDVIRQIAERRGFEVEVMIPEEEDVLAEEPDEPADLVMRAPVITVMGHVDHGKTTLLDRVRKANVAAGEAGGITQHIAAYNVQMPSGRVVFLDTPGHEAFTQMRARGAKVTDVVVLVVAADDGVMPQTIEAIDHARAAEVPIVVAVNKCDKPDAQPDRIRQELTAYNLVDEQWGGKTIIRNISAKIGDGVDELMELLVLEADLLELKANPKKRARGVVVESEITRGMGPVAWVLVQNGTLRVGDVFLAGECYGRVRTLQDSRGESVDEAGPSTPVVVTGFNAPPEAGTSFVVLQDERVAKAIAEKRAMLSKQRLGPTVRHITLEDFHERMLAGEKKQLNVVIKGDVQGSVDVLQTSLAKLGNEDVRVSLVHGGVGGINESDVFLASASDAVVIGFHVTASGKVQKIAEQEGVDIRTYRVIYEAISDVRAALEGMLAPEIREVVIAHAEIRQVFRSSAVGNIAGCYVQDGEVVRGSLVRLLRDGVVIYEGKIQTLRRMKDDVRSVAAGLECGIKIENFDDIKVGDVIEVYQIESIAKVLP